MQEFERRLIDVAQASATVRDVLMKNKTRKGQRLLGILTYTYIAPFTAVAAAAASTGTYTNFNLQTQGDSDFLILYMSGLVFNSATQANIAAPFSRIQISDNSSNRSMYNIPQYFSTACGNAGFPYILQDPRLIPASTVITVQYYNDSTVGPISHDAQVCFGGYRAVYQQ